MPIDPSASVHLSAVVAPEAKIGPNTTIGPFSVIGPEVTLGPDVNVKSHAVITGWTEVGRGTEVFPFACIGEIPQDLKYSGEHTRLVVGQRNRIREGVTMNVGTHHGGGVTVVGDDCLFMTGAHVGHDVRVGNGVIMANQAALGGHCVIQDHAIIGGLAGIHQFVRIGRGAIIGALTMVRRDVIPYGFVQGPAGSLEGLNLVGLKRRGVKKPEIAALTKSYKKLESLDGPFRERIIAVKNGNCSCALFEHIANFVLGDSDRAFLTPNPSANASTDKG